MTELTQLAMFKQRDVEKLFAACVFASPLETVQQCGWLRPEVITDYRISKYWQAVTERIKPELSMTGQATDEILSITVEHDLLHDVSEWAGQTFLYNALPYANEISRRSYLVNISSKIGDLLKAVQQSDDNLARMTVKSMAELDVTNSTNAPVAFDIAELFDQVVMGGARSIQTHIIPLDNATGGLERQTSTYIAARPSIGKTALAWQIARTVAYSRLKVLFFSLEMSAVNLWGRASCPLINTTWRDVRAGKLTAEQKERLLAESYKLAANYDENLHIIDAPQTTETIWQATAQYRPDLIIVDHLRNVRDKHPSEVKRQGMIAERLKDVAKNFNCASLVLAQLNRQSEIRGEKRPQLSDLRDSGEIEEVADLIFMLYREEDNIDNITEVWIRKFRDGPRDVLIRLRFDPRQDWFDVPR